MDNIEKEIECLKKISTFGSMIEEVEEMYYPGCSPLWFVGKTAVVGLPFNYTHKSPFPSSNEYNAFILPEGISEKQAINSPDLNRRFPDQWLAVTLTEQSTVREVTEENLGIMRCMLSFKRNFRMRQVNLDDEF